MNKKSTVLSFCIIISISFLLIQQAYSQISLSAKTDFTAGTRTRSVAIADFNGDGKPDMATANYDASTVSVLMNTTTPGASTPTFSAKTDFSTANGPYSVSIGDINGDGKQDLAVSNYLSNSVSVFLNTTTPDASIPTFTAKTDFTVGVDAISVSIGDLNGDGKPDLAVVNHGPNSVSVLLNTTTTGASTPTFSANTDFTTGSTPYSVSIGDLNSDGKPDLAVACASANVVSVFLNTTTPGASTPTFTAKTDIATGSGSRTVSIGDLNGDGKPDLAVAVYNVATVSVYLNTTTPGASTPTFSASTDYSTPTGPFAVTIGDLNRDGKPDLTVVNFSSNSISVFLNLTTPGASTPTFDTKVDFVSGNLPHSASIRDLNGDGKPDLAVANSSSNSVSVFLNTMVLGVTPSFESGTSFFTGNNDLYEINFCDINNDGKQDMYVMDWVVSSAFSVFLNTTTPGASTPIFSSKTSFGSGGSSGGASGDINGDGKIDIVASNNSAGGSIRVCLNTTAPGASTPTFSLTTFSVILGAYDVVVKDFNGDGVPDIAVTNQINSGTVTVYINTTTPGAGTPTLAAAVTFPCGNYPQGLASADMNGDGKPDLVTPAELSREIYVLLNTTTAGSTTPAFTSTAFSTFPYSLRGISVADVNGDGKQDISTVLYSNNFLNTVDSVGIFLNTTTIGASTPTLNTMDKIRVGSIPKTVQLSDINGDGKSDLVSVCSDGVIVNLNTTTPGASSSSFGSKTTFNGNFAALTLAISDVNNDGKPDIISDQSDDPFVKLNTALYPVPVELALFTSSVSGNNIMLNWNTVMEENNSGFDIERNSFGAGWTKIGFVAGKGTTNISQNYSFADNGLNTGRYSYRLKQIDYNGNYKYYDLQNEVVIGVPNKFALMQNYPNPFNPSTKINYELPITNYVSLKIFDITGKEVGQLVNGVQQAGYYAVDFNAASLSSGTYFYKLTSDKFSDVKKMVVIK